MSPISIRSASFRSAVALFACGAPALASASETSLNIDPVDVSGFELSEADAVTSAQDRPQTSGPPPSQRPGDPPMGKPVFDDTWITIGVGAGLVPSYSGSDEYVFFPLPLIVGRVGGVGLRPNGPGLSLDLLSQAPTRGERPDTQINFGPSFRFRNDRDQQIVDEVVKLADPLDTALEVGANAGLTFNGVLNPVDALSVGVQARWDVLGAHDGMLVEPGVTYFTPLGRATVVQLAAGLQFVDDDFADYYYSITPEQSAQTGLDEFTASGGLNSIGLNLILTRDLDGNALNGGFNIYSIGSYSRLVGDAADTPFTAERGSANQFFGGVGVGYTF